MSDDRLGQIHEPLLAWFDRVGRDLPWRRTSDPYAIWVSEVMLQQTRVQTAVSYYERWLRRFPDVHALARAPLDDVLKAWEGLGYYARGRNLHAAAQVVRERHGGELPDTYAALRALPGVGDYTAGAVASIAYGACEPAVDGNARRVLARLLDLAAPRAQQVRAAAAALVPHDRPGDFNQALMELGATVCTPRNPRCDVCPLREACAAHKAGSQHERPGARPKRSLPVVSLVTVILRRADGHVLLVRRPARGLLALMWTFPAAETASGMDAAETTRAVARAYAQPRGPAKPLGVVEHTFSHRRERYDCHEIRVAPRPVTADTTLWVGRDTSGVALPRAQQRIHRMAFTS